MLHVNEMCYKNQLSRYIKVSKTFWQLPAAVAWRQKQLLDLHFTTTHPDIVPGGLWSSLIKVIQRHLNSLIQGDTSWTTKAFLSAQTVCSRRGSYCTAVLFSVCLGGDRPSHVSVWIKVWLECKHVHNDPAGKQQTSEFPRAFNLHSATNLSI